MCLSLSICARKYKLGPRNHQKSKKCKRQLAIARWTRHNEKSPESPRIFCFQLANNELTTRPTLHNEKTPKLLGSHAFNMLEANQKRASSPQRVQSEQEARKLQRALIFWRPTRQRELKWLRKGTWQLSCGSAWENKATRYSECNSL